jgi:hypothetical protein
MSRTAWLWVITGFAAPLLCSARDGHAAAPIPDFSGMWGRNAFDLEPPPSGPGPILNIKRLPSGIGDPNALVGDWRNSILKPEAAEAVKRAGEIALSGKNFPDPSNQCAPWQPTFAAAMELGVQILQSKDHVTFLYNQDDQVRFVPLNVGHPAHLTPSWKGDSVGHYEGDTLVIDTVGIEAHPVSVVDRYGTPHSDELHVIERYRLIDGKRAKELADDYQKREGPAGLGGAVRVDDSYVGKGLLLELTVEDPKVFTTPWEAFVTYRRNGRPWMEQICAENIQEYYTGSVTGVPKAEKPDF